MKDCCECPDISRWVPSFAGFMEFTASVPKLYWNVKSQEQRILAICKQLHKLICYADMLGDKIEIEHTDIVELKALFDKFMQSGFDEYYAKQVEAWIDKNLKFIFDHTVKQVYFGLNEQGYFVAYIPESWDDIIFDTGIVYGSDTYGRLILRWDVDNSGESVNQRPEDWS